jgi:hypothetical protein
LLACRESIWGFRALKALQNHVLLTLCESRGSFADNSDARLQNTQKHLQPNYFTQFKSPVFLFKLINELKERELREKLKGDRETMKQIEQEFDSIQDADKWVNHGFGHVELPIKNFKQLKPIDENELNKQQPTFTSRFSTIMQPPLVSENNFQVFASNIPK